MRAILINRITHGMLALLALAGHAPAGQLLLLPAPREITYTGETYRLTGDHHAKAEIAPGRIGHREGYRLTITTEGIEIVAHDEAGGFYAQQTLDQILSQTADRTLPTLVINDWPDYPNRGVMLDISRDKVPTMRTLERLVDTLASWKINQLQLYTEHAFAYRNHEVVWHNASPMTASEMRDLDAYCKARHIELVPNQNTFGHMQRWLVHESYRHLAEIHPPVDGIPDDQLPFTLSPAEPGSLELVNGLLDELLPNFSSGQVNIGGDETFDLGLGKARQMCEERGQGRVYLDYILAVNRMAAAHGKRVQFWGDIILNHPELIPELPENMLAMVWGYEPYHPFDEVCAKFKAAGVSFYVCPGTCTWRTLGGKTATYRVNLVNAASNGLKHGAIGLLNTNWGDHGHWQPDVVCYPPYAYGAGLSWSFESNKDMDIPAVMDRLFFRDRSRRMGRLVHELGNVHELTHAPVNNASMIQYMLHDPLGKLAEGRIAMLEAQHLRTARDRIDELLGQVDGVDLEHRDADLLVAEFRLAANLMRFAMKLTISRLEVEGHEVAAIPAGQRRVLAESLRTHIREFKRLWLLRNRPGGLGNSIRPLDELLEKLHQGPG